MNPEMALVSKRNEEREALRSVIQQWNANRLDLFELSEPNENLEFHGVMRFYFQDSGQKVATKCIRVASDATAQDVIETLIEKFRPDMRMLSLPEYALFEIHENGEERKLAMDEKPLLVQLNWHKDDREGRFLLRRLDDKTNMPTSTFQQDGSSFRRKLSKREKKQLKKQEKLNRLKSAGVNDENDARVAEKLYSELPETSFTRSISNPEAVMRRRRQQKLERKLQQFRSKDGGPDTGGTLKIYGESLCRDVPYKTLLLSIRDTAQQVVREMLVKYGLEKEDPHNYCLVQVNGFSEYSKENNNQNNINNNNNTLNNQEYILDDDECPLAILMNHPQSQGSIMFHVRRRPADYHPRKRKKKPQHKWNQQQSVSSELLEYRYEDGLDRLPLFLELNPDGSEICGGVAKRHRLHPNVTEVGCERNSSPTQSQFLQLFGPNILPRHCVIANTDGIVTVTPCSRDSETYVNGQRIYETTILRNGAIVKFGRIHCFRFLDPYFEERIRQRQDSLRNIHEYAYDRQSMKEDSSSQTTATAEIRRNSSAPNADAPTSHNFETTFDVDGNIETRSTSSQGNKEDSRSQRSIGSGSKDGNRIPSSVHQRQGGDAILPAVLEIREETEEALLNEIIISLDPNTPTFKLAPAYCLYLMARYRASTHYRPELTPTERAHRLTLMLARVAGMIQKTIQERYCDVVSLALWLANSSELLFFLQSDRHLFAFSKDAQRMLFDSVRMSFRYLMICVRSDLSATMPHFFTDKDDASHDHEESSSVLAVLQSAMALLRRYRVNVALTVQLFSHLFHFINAWAFNRLIASNTNYCSRIWGTKLRARLAQIEAWAERQGLEITTGMYLARIVQAAELLQAPKYNAEDLAAISSACFLLNSLQLKTLLMKYRPAHDEPPLPQHLIDNIVRVAETLADELIRSKGREVKLEQDPDLELEFVWPIDGYSCEVVRGIPSGLIEFVAPLQSMGLCRLSTQPTSNGLWTVYMELPHMNGPMLRSPSAMSNRSMGNLPGPIEPEIQVIRLQKASDGSGIDKLGLSILVAQGPMQEKSGIFIKSLVPKGAADMDGRLQAGDELLKVNGQSLAGMTQNQAAEYLEQAGLVVTLEVAKQSALYNGLATLLSQPEPQPEAQPSPAMSRDGRRPRSQLFPEPVRDKLPSSFSMINLNQHMLTEHEVQCMTRSGVTSNDDTGCCKIGGGSVGKSLRTRRRNSFQPRYGNFLHPDYALLYPNNLCQSSDNLVEEENEEENRKDSRLTSRTVLTSNSYNRMPVVAFPSIPSTTDHKLCLCEDVFQKNAAEGNEKEPKLSSITKRLVSDVTSCCLGVLPESDTSIIADPRNTVSRVSTNDKSVMTDEALLCNGSEFLSEKQYGIIQERNSCSLMPPTDDLCECEKPIFSSQTHLDQPARGKIIYQNGLANTVEPVQVTPAAVTVTSQSIAVDNETFLKNVMAFNEHYQHNNLQNIFQATKIRNQIGEFKSMEDLNMQKDTSSELSSRRSSSDISLYQKNSLIAECTRCGNRFDIRGTYFNGPVFENITSSTTSVSESTDVTSSTNNDTGSTRTTEINEKNRKLTKKEREDILLELEEIISGEFFNRVRSPATSKRQNCDSFSSPMLHLDLHELKDGNSSSKSSTPSLNLSNVSSSNSDLRYKGGRVAELAKYFSKLGQAGIIRTGTGGKFMNKSVPNLPEHESVVVVNRSASMTELTNQDNELTNQDNNGPVLSEFHDSPMNGATEACIPPMITDADSGACTRRRQSFARQNTVFCKMRSVDELDLKKSRTTKSKLNKYASLSDFRAFTDEGNVNEVPDLNKIVSSDNLSGIITTPQKETSTLPTSFSSSPSSSLPSNKQFCLEAFLLKNKPSEEGLKINYDKMTTAIRDYLANKELLLKRMKSNSIDNYGVRGRAFTNLNRTCPNFTSVRDTNEPEHRREQLFKTGYSMDALFYSKEMSPTSGDVDDFIFKDNIRRVYKGPYVKGRRFRTCRKLVSRRSGLIFSGDCVQRFRLNTDSGGKQSLQMRCQSLDTAMDGGMEPSRGRRMSERDLPARVSNEQSNQVTQLPMHAPLIHSSKSVPSLNSSGVNDGQIVSSVASRSSHEVYNTSYNSTSSSNSIHQHQAALRSRSSQNLNDSRSLSNYPTNISASLSNHRPSTNIHYPSNSSAIPLYQQSPCAPQSQQQHPMYHQHVQQQMLLHQQQQQQQHQHQHQQHQQQPQQHQHQLPHQYLQHNNSVTDTGERFYQNLSVYRNHTHDMINGVLHEGMSNVTPKGKLLSPPQDRSSNQFQRSFRGSQSSLQPQQSSGRQSAEMTPTYLRERPSSAYVQKENYPPQGMSGRSQSTRDMLRQEAKLHEMTEEVKRREMRSNYPQSQYPVGQARIRSPGDSADANVAHYHQRPGHPGPVMYNSDGQPTRPPYPSHKNNIMRHNIEEIGYRESPPPPPPPPTSTHPLYQPSNVQKSPDSRYTASVGDAPKVGYYPSSPVTASSKHYQLQGTNPWEREEREKEAERRREAAKEWRDQQINELLSLGPNRNPSQEEQLRSLRLEKEFERRAQEEEEEDDEDQETTERIQDVIRTAREQDEIRNSIHKNSNYTTPSSGRWTNVHSQMNGTAGHSQSSQNTMEEKERLRRLKEMKMKQAEHESMKIEENRLKHKVLQEDDFNTSGLNGHAGLNKTLNRPTHLRLENSHSNQNHVNNSYSNLQDYSTLTALTAPQQRLDNLLEQSGAPTPPERGSSFAVMSQALRSPVTTPSSAALTNTNRHDVSQLNCTITPKKVSFQETASEIIGSNSTPIENTLEDPNRFINEAESMLASPKSPDTQFIGSTPGVIGTQEVYKDPRQRRLAEQQHQKLLSNKVVPVPEKLTFKEKMKMFAMETGEEGTPKDKVKISRAQRDIDNLNSPSMPNNVSKNSSSENVDCKVKNN